MIYGRHRSGETFWQLSNAFVPCRKTLKKYLRNRPKWYILSPMKTIARPKAPLSPVPSGGVFSRKTGATRTASSVLEGFGARYLNPQTGLWLSVDPAVPPDIQPSGNAAKVLLLMAAIQYFLPAPAPKGVQGSN